MCRHTNLKQKSKNNRGSYRVEERIRRIQLTARAVTLSRSNITMKVRR